jgi:hypothetical protein
VGTLPQAMCRRPPPPGLFNVLVAVHIDEGFEASESDDVAILGDGIGLIEPQDNISESAWSGEDAWVACRRTIEGSE